MQLYLVAHWLYPSIAKQVRKKLNVKVAHTDAFSHSCIDQGLQLLPKHMQRLLLFTEELSRPVNQVKVNIGKLQAIKRALKFLLWIVILSFPDLSRNE